MHGACWLWTWLYNIVVVSWCITWCPIRCCSFRTFRSILGRFNRTLHYRFKNRIAAFLVVKNLCSNPSFFFLRLSFLLLRLLLFLASALFSTFLHSSFLVVGLAPFSWTWRPMDSTMRTKWRTLAQVTVTTQSSSHPATFSRLFGTSSNTAVDYMAWASRRCVSQVTWVKLGMFAMGVWEITPFAPGKRSGGPGEGVEGMNVYGTIRRRTVGMSAASKHSVLSGA